MAGLIPARLQAPNGRAGRASLPGQLRGLVEEKQAGLEKYWVQY